jgi:hypothetical protein
MKKDIKPFLFFSIIASLLVGHLANRTALIFEGLTGNLVENINAAIDATIPALQNNPFMIGTSKTALISGAIGAACVWLIFLYNVFGAKNFMRGSEHGSARWGTAKDIKPLTDREPDMNIPLSATEQISVRKVKDFEADRNKNIVVVGGSGSGKTYSEIKPSLMQLHSSYVITDPKGTILPETGYLFTNNGYTVRSFNTIDFSKSLHYNPLAYIHKEKDILKVVTVLMENTNGEGTGSGEKFWKDCEKLLYTALIAYLWYEAPPEDQNIPMMIEMLDMCKVKEDDEDYQSPIDIKLIKIVKSGAAANYPYTLTESSDGVMTFYCTGIEYAPTYTKGTLSVQERAERYKAVYGIYPYNYNQSINNNTDNTITDRVISSERNPDVSEYARELDAYVKDMIVGTWKGTFDEWPTADSIYWSYTFSADGTYSFTNGTTTEAGTYTITSDPNNNYYHSSMQLTFDGGERTMQFYFTTTNPVKMITDDQTDPTYLKSLV